MQLLEEFLQTEQEQCDNCGDFYTPNFTYCECEKARIKTVKLIDGKKPLDWALEKVNGK